jgi:hypothetical protein
MMMKKKIRSRKTYLILTLVSLLIASLACNLPDFGQGEPHEEPFHEGEGEPHPEDEAFEHHEEEMDPHEEEHDEHHDEGDHEEPHEEDPGPEADLAVTDIFPKKLPHGKLNVRVTNNGPTPLTSYPADLTCEAHGVSWGGPEHGEEDRSYHQEIIIQAAPGETVVIKTDIKIDANLYQYDVICEINADIDPIPDNNAYDEVIPPSNNP